MGSIGVLGIILAVVGVGPRRILLLFNCAGSVNFG